MGEGEAACHQAAIVDVVVFKAQAGVVTVGMAHLRQDQGVEDMAGPRGEDTEPRREYEEAMAHRPAAAMVVPCAADDLLLRATRDLKAHTTGDRRPQGHMAREHMMPDHLQAHTAPDNNLQVRLQLLGITNHLEAMSLTIPTATSRAPNRLHRCRVSTMVTSPAKPWKWMRRHRRQVCPSMESAMTTRTLLAC